MIYNKASGILVSVLCVLFFSSLACGADKKDTTSDTWLQAKLVTSYTLNQHLNPLKIDVDVVNGVATLSGTVDSDIERDLAVEIARGIDGIKEVKDDLKIEPQESPEKENDFARMVEDATTTAKVKYRLLLNRNMDSLDIDVDTRDSVVTLSGTVDSDTRRELAVKLAENTTGVKKVLDNLTVASEEGSAGEKSESSIKKEIEELSGKVKDTWITAKAKTVLLISSEAEGAVYDVSTRDAEITITGTVLSREQAGEIQKILEDLQGVREVKNRLEVR